MAQEAPTTDRPSDPAIIGANIYRLRHPAYGPMISRESLAKSSGVSEETIRKLEAARHGSSNPNVQTDKLSAIARALGVQTGALYDWPTRVMLHGFPPDLHAVPPLPARITRRATSDRRQARQLPLVAAAK